MSELLNPAAIFLPMLAVVLLTFVAFVRMAAGRGAAMKAGQDPAYYRAQLGDPEPEVAVVGVRHYHNLLELPTLFYPACLLAYLLDAVSGWTLLWAWGYVAARLAQSAVHLTYNNPAHRGLAFVLGALFLFTLWVALALAVFARI